MADIRATTPGAKGAAYPLQPNATYLGEVKIVHPDNTVGVYVKKLSSTFSRCKVVGSPLLKPIVKGDRVVCGLLDGLKQEMVVYGSYDTTGDTSTGVLDSLTVTGDVTVDTSTLKVDATNNRVGVGTTSPQATLDVQATTGTAMRITNSGTGESFRVEDATGDITPFVIDASGNVGMGTATPLARLHITDGSANIRLNTTTVGADALNIVPPTSFNSRSITLNTATLTATRTVTLPDATGTVITTGNLTDFTVTAGTTTTAASGVGYMGLPQNSTTTGAYRLVAADAGKHIYSTATRTITVPGNASGGTPQVAFPVGTTIVFVNATGAVLTLSMDGTTTDTLLLAGTGTTGTRTLAAFGMATLLKITSTSWIISGNGLT